MEETKLGKFSIKYLNGLEYHSIKREVWGQDSYYFETTKNNPLIIDIGSHIGISVLYFKSIYPNCRVLAFEPNPTTFEILRENIDDNQLKDVEIFNKAIWRENGIKSFYVDSKTNGWESNSSFLKNSWTGKEVTKEIKVETTTLEKYITEDIDMLKIDTEGSEFSILKAHKRFLNRVKNITVEYHPSKDNNLEEMLSILRQYFTIEIYHEGKILKKTVKDKLLTIKGKQSI